MHQCRDIDALMMDWLYGELDPQKAQSFSTHVEDCTRCESELAAYQRTRELVGDLPSEEPPAALSALLIREAATRTTPAKTEASSGGVLAWIGKLFQPLQHPALAAVATLVLVAGVAGTLYLRDGDDQFVEPTTDTASEPAAIETGALPASPEPTSEASEEPELGSEPARQVDLLEGEDKEVADDLLEKARKRPARERTKIRPQKKGRAKTKPKLDYKANAISGGDPLDLETDKDDFAGKDEKPAQNRPYRAYRDRPGSWVESQQLRITEAYNRDDCRTAARIANDILDRSPELYTKRTKKLEAVKRCRAYVKRERNRRAVARKKRRNSSSKAATKAKKSPAPEPAADVEQAVE